MSVISTDSQQPDFQLRASIDTMQMERIRPRESTLLQKMKQFTRFLKSEHAISSLKQFIVLFQMMLLKLCRNRLVLWIQLGHHLLCGLCIGLIFWNSANDGTRMFDHLKFCMGVVFMVVYTQMMVPILSCKLKKKKNFLKDSFNNRFFFCFCFCCCNNRSTGTSGR